MKIKLHKPLVGIVSALLVVVAFGLAWSDSEVTMPSKSYLLLVSFYSKQINQNNLTKVRENVASVINASPYHGIAVSGISANQQLGTRNIDWMANTGIKKQIWPWVFFNRFIGYPPGVRPPAGQEFFACIKGMDLFDQCNALTDFLEILRQSTAMAKQLGSPGIILDPEAYNDRKIYGVEYTKEVMGLDESQLIAALKNVGSKMHDVVSSTYPDCVVWTFFSPLYEKSPRTVTYIMMGFLERAAATHSRVKLVAGGEVGLSYCSVDLPSLQQKVATRNTNFAPFLVKYPNLRLGGTLSPWLAASQKSGWLTRGQCGACTVQNIAEFKDWFQYLFSQFSYVWIYAAGDAKYDPFNPAVASQVNSVLSAAYDQATVPTTPR